VYAFAASAFFFVYASGVDPGLVLSNVTVRYGDLTVLNGMSLELERGRALVVGGASGVGKSTFLQVSGGLIPAASWTVRLAGHQAYGVRPSDLFRRGVRRGYVFEQGGLLHNLSAMANVTLALRYHADLLGIDEREIDRRARQALLRLRVSQADLHALPAHLSFGTQKRVAIARILVLKPNFVFCDDPDLGLDSASASIVYDVLAELRDDPNVTLLITTNSRPLTERLRTKSLELVNGYLLERALA
jgi:ABC-type transporter Mla maintaining outer membrane lipid asymmetry ATPase subunit MlaF